MAPGRPYGLPALIVLVVAGTLVQGALTPRDLSLGEGAVVTATGGDLVASSLSRAFTAAALLLSLAAVTAALILRGFPRGGLSIWLLFLVYFLTNFVFPAFLARVRGLDVRLLYPPLVFTGVYFARPLGPGALVTACKLALGAFIYGALVGAVLVPDHTVASDYSGLIPALTIRLYGIGGGATSLGAQAAAFLAIEAVAPSRSWTRHLHVLAALVVLVLTQSKTSWVFILLVGLYWLYRGVERWLFREDTEEAAEAGSTWLWRWLFRAASACAVLGLAVAAFGFLASAEQIGTSNIQTLTGRTYIWETTFRLWLDSPVFGYGLGLWDTEAFRAEYGSFAHAHNQFLHSLGSAGLVGLVGLLVYFGSAWATSVRAARTNAVPLVLLALVTAQCLTEVPLRLPYILDPYAVLHLLLFASLVQAEQVEAG